MSYSTVAGQLAGILAGVDGVGRVHRALVHARDVDRVRALYGSPVEGRTGRIGGWMITRESVRERAWTQLRTRAFEAWRLTGYGGMESGPGQVLGHDEAEFTARVQLVHDALRAVTDFGDVVAVQAPVTGVDVQPVLLGADRSGVLCWRAEISVELELRPERGDAIDDTAPDPSVTARGNPETVAGDIAGLLAEAGAVNAHRGRPFSPDRGEADALMLAPDPSGSGKDVIRQWEIWRRSDVEERQLWPHVAVASRWGLRCSWQWEDSAHSYVAVQEHVDEVRAVFRRVGRVGNPTNPTLSLSDPLQVDSVTEHQFGGRLAHVVECTLPVREATT